MKALLIGSGAVGIGLGASLADSGWHLDIVAKGATKEAIERYGMIRRGLFKEIKVPAGKLGIFETIDAVSSAYDYILVCTKTTVSAKIAQELWENKRILKNEGKVVLFQNGFENDEVFLSHFGPEQIYSARVITGFSRPEYHISEVTVHAAPVLIGSLYRMSLLPILPLVQAIQAGGIPCEATEEIGKALWAKMLYNCALNPLGAILDVNYGKLIENDYTMKIMNHIIEEIFEVMSAAGYHTYWQDAKSYQEEFYGKLVPTTYDHRSSTLQDIERKLRTEIDNLTFVIVKLGKKHRINVPYNEMIYQLIKAKECNY